MYEFCIKMVLILKASIFHCLKTDFEHAVFVRKLSAYGFQSRGLAILSASVDAEIVALGYHLTDEFQTYGEVYHVVLIWAACTRCIEFLHDFRCEKSIICFAKIRKYSQISAKAPLNRFIFMKFYHFLIKQVIFFARQTKTSVHTFGINPPYILKYFKPHVETFLPSNKDNRYHPE